MTERRLQKNSAAEEIPGTPRIRDVRIVFGSEVTGLCGRGSSRVPFKLKDNYVSSCLLNSCCAMHVQVLLSLRI